eukprot:TRINITY_DN10121_c0_g1_i2.p1 TRINITY_DN10121_c0_g1~~TRINITY_DN10121_c0_g1_i2.p1  ORF type:complete len:255 (-),score=72.16 TRINITY_DN10121_c0_g1_i2:24-788(-)
MELVSAHHEALKLSAEVFKAEAALAEAQNVSRKEIRAVLAEAHSFREEAVSIADDALIVRKKVVRTESEVEEHHQMLREIDSMKSEAATFSKAKEKLFSEQRTVTMELQEAKEASRKALRQKTLALEESSEASEAATEALNACRAAEEERLRVKKAVQDVTEDLEAAARSHRHGEELEAQSEATHHLLESLQAEVKSQHSRSIALREQIREEQSCYTSAMAEAERLRPELHALSRLTCMRTSKSPVRSPRSQVC